MAKKRQLVLMRSESGPAGLVSLGNAQAVREMLAPFNTAPDGGPRKSIGTELLHGPGMVVELPTTAPEIMQAMVTVTDDDIAWPVLSKLCKVLKWKMIDLESGQSFG